MWPEVPTSDRELITLQAASFVLEWFFCNRILFPVRLLSVGPMMLSFSHCLFP